MEAYHGNQNTKSKYVERMKDHMAADELVRGNGIGFEDGKGCAVGCTLNNYDHHAFETEIGIPSWLAHILDTLHENTSDNVWPTYSLRFLEAIKPGVNLDAVKSPFLIFVLNHCKKTVVTLSISKKLEQNIIKALNGSIELYEQPMNIAASDAAQAYAIDIAASADTARAYAAADTRNANVHNYADRYTTYAKAVRLARAATGGANAVCSNANAASMAVNDAAAASSADLDNDVAYDLFAEKLIELIGECAL